MASESASRSTSAADSYIGSLISLTSKSEIRYEGVLYNINTEESSIGLRNVRSFGTEGRKKDGPQVPPSDKVFEYILFRGSDIKISRVLTSMNLVAYVMPSRCLDAGVREKTPAFLDVMDLQVKSSPPVQPTPLINNDPAIIQSHFPRPVSTAPSLPPPVSGPLPDINSQAMPMGIPGSNFQGGLPLYQPGGNVGSWGASPSPPPPNPSAGGLALPMYWQGYYGPPLPNGLPHMHQQSLLRPPPGLSMPSSLQQPVQYPNLNTSLPTGVPNLLEVPSSFFFANPTAPSLSSIAMPPVTLSSTIPSVEPNKIVNSVLPQAPLGASLPSLSPLTTSSDAGPVVPPATNKATTISGPALSYQTISQSTSSIAGTSNSVLTSAPAPTLVTPGQLLQNTAVSSSLSLQTAQKDVEAVQASSSLAAEQSVPVPADTQPPLLPLPVSSRALQKFPQPNGPTSQSRHIYRGRGRGRRSGNSHQTEKFTEDFDFIAMNEKFNKDEVWGHLGKNTKSHPKYNDGDEKFSDEDEAYDEEDGEPSKPMYNKDDFFDTLSSNVPDHEAQNGRRSRYFEQIKLDTETFGDSARYRGRGGFASGRGGRRGGYYGRGYGYVGRGGRGRYMPNYNP